VWALAELAARQHGVVTRTQLVALGFGAGEAQCLKDILRDRSS